MIFLLSEKNLKHFLQGRSTGKDSLNFCLSEEVFIAPSILKDDSVYYRIIGWWGFSLNAINISLYSQFKNFFYFMLEYS